MRVVKEITGGQQGHNGDEQDFKRGQCYKKAMVQIKRGVRPLCLKTLKFEGALFFHRILSPFLSIPSQFSPKHPFFIKYLKFPIFAIFGNPSTFKLWGLQICFPALPL